MKNFSNLIDILLERSDNEGEKLAYSFLGDGETQTARLTYQELGEKAKAIAANLQSCCKKGDRALLLYPPGLEFIVAFYGCLLGGIIAVPAYPPRKQGKNSALLSILEDAQPKVILTESSILGNIQRKLGDKQKQILATDKIEIEQGNNWVLPQINGETIAFLQYTSGSTGRPKGVIINHENLIHNCEKISTLFEVSTQSKGVIWLPPYHDMGLIGGILEPLYGGFAVSLMSPLNFLQKPIKWLQAISKYRGEISGGPNFAYELCVSKITSQEKETLDLSSWEVAFIGAEPIRVQTLEKFTTAFAGCGFRRETFYPCYGMAEATLFVSGGRKTAPPVIDYLEENSRKIVGCGQGWLDEKIVIVNPQFLTECEAKEVGEIWVNSASVASGYWNKPEETEQTFKAYLKQHSEPFLRTGDLGFIKEGELFVTGRLKELIIIRGRNYYPQDIEEIVEKSHPSLQANCSAAFGVEINGEEKLVVVAEVERSQSKNLDVDAAIGSIKKALSEELEIGIYAIQLLRTASIPKTSSGKIKRSACKQGFLEGTLNIVGEWRDEEDTPPTPPLVRGGNEELPTEETIKNWLKYRLAKAAKVEIENIDIYQSFDYYGLDSMVAVTITNELAEWLGTELKPTLFWEYPNIEAVAKYLGENQ